MFYDKENRVHRISVTVTVIRMWEPNMAFFILLYCEMKERTRNEHLDLILKQWEKKIVYHLFWYFNAKTEYLKTNYTAYCIKKIISWCLTKFSIEIEIHMQNECKLFTVKILCNTLWVVNKLAPFILHSTLIMIWMYTCMDCIIVVVYKCGLYL